MCLKFSTMQKFLLEKKELESKNWICFCFWRLCYGTNEWLWLQDKLSWEHHIPENSDLWWRWWRWWGWVEGKAGWVQGGSQGLKQTWPPMTGQGRIFRLTTAHPKFPNLWSQTVCLCGLGEGRMLVNPRRKRAKVLAFWILKATVQE
jgi:hypothetical protein